MSTVLHIVISFVFCCSILGHIEAYPSEQENLSKYSQGATQISNLNIKSFCQDSLGYMWIATPRGLNRYNGYEFLQYFHDPEDSASIDNDFVLSLFLDSFHRLWVGTSAGVNCYHFETDQFEHYRNNSGKTIYVYSFFEDHNHCMWAATQAGPGMIDAIHREVNIQTPSRNQNVNLFMEDATHKLWMGMSEKQGLAVRRNNDSWNYFTLPGNRWVTCVYSDPQGIWWLGTNSGIVLFDPVSRGFKDAPSPCLSNAKLNRTQINFIKEISPLRLLIGTASQGFFQYDILSRTLLHNEPEQWNLLHSSQLVSCYTDRQDNVWIGSFDKGFIVWNSYLNYFNADRRLSDTFKDKFVTRIVEDIYKNLWVSTRYYGLFCYTSSGKLISYNSQNSDLFQDDNCLIESLFIDSRSRIWIGLTDQLIEGKISDEGKITGVSRKDLQRVGTMKEDRDGNLWIGSLYGLFRIEKGNSDLPPQLIYSSNVPDICILESGDLLFSSYGEGIFRLSPNDTIPLPFSPFSGKSAMVTQHCITLYQDTQQRIWMGSYGGGLLCLSPDSGYIHFDQRSGLPSNDILCFQEDKHGDMWMSTSFGISRLRLADTVFVNYFSSDGTLGDQYHEKAGLKHSDGRIFFAGNHGLTFFNPMGVLTNKYPPAVLLEDLKILNQSIRPASGYVLTKSLPFAKQIMLNHKQSVVSIDYSGIDFLVPQKLTYAYQLKGFDAKWNFVGNYRRATYSNLPPGKYVFKVKAINGEGIESSSPATLQITVKPAPWFSWQALVLYLLGLVSVILILFRAGINKKMGQRMLEMEHFEREREREVSEMKMNFFTNISHELRTPLTLISAPLEQILSMKTLDSVSMRLLNTISRNVQNMLKLINQLLDFRKMENGILGLQVEQTDAIQFIRNIQEVFIFPAEKKRVILEFAPHTSRFTLWIDTDKIEKILHNLLSNALKHTPANGTVKILTNELSIAEANSRYQTQNYSYFEVIVSDTGTGVPADRLDELFVRYRQIEGPSGRKPDYGGSGIGLHYTKFLVETHYGQIRAKIKDEGGMAFSFILPIGEVYSENEKKTEKKITENRIHVNRGTKAEKSQKHPYTILIAEDNAELMNFIRNLLSSQYELIEALDGDKAWLLTQSEFPDLILSDVLMPGLSGYELCSRVKQHPSLSHIPVILLTAKSTVSDQVEGLEQGADAYICKPFHIDYLLLTIKNLFMSRDRLRQYFSTPQTKENTTTPVILNQHDQKFMDKLTQILERELANPDLNIESIARDLGFSRTGFYRKIKGLTDMSPVDFTRSYRLRRAAEMIRENSLSLSEVAGKTGFNFYPYFSKSFKKHFGISPKEYSQS